MLTWSDWRTEPRSNRYHWSTRLARHVPVFFVQPDGRGKRANVEPSGVPGITLVHVAPTYDTSQVSAIARVLNDSGLRRPLLWIYNTHFVDFVIRSFSPLKIYHATEDYFSPEGSTSRDVPRTLSRLLQHVDLVVAVSEAVLESYVKRGGYRGESLVLPNGCDYSFWATDLGSDAAPPPAGSKPMALYQGGINSRLDLGLLSELTGMLPDWEFAFCGPVQRGLKEWGVLKARPNVVYHGFLEPEHLRGLARRASVGLIPFAQNALMDASLPLKAFEYAACGLPVVSIPIRALAKHPTLFSFAEDAREFAAALPRAAATRWDLEKIAERRGIAQRYDYDARFHEFLAWLTTFGSKAQDGASRLNIAMLYDPGSTHIATLREHLTGFRIFSRHEVYFVPATASARPRIDLSLFDVAVIHYSVRLSLEEHLSRSLAKALQNYPGLKVLFIQDEYDTTETARRWIERLGIHIVFTCVPEQHIDKVYPRQRFARVEFVPTLTGYVPIDLRRNPRPLKDREFLIGYRGRALPYWYGNLGQEKLLIGKRMREICDARGIPVDIEWDDDKRIYGSPWYDFLESARATLGTESGSNILDEHGQIRAAIENALDENPSLTYQQAYVRYLAAHEGLIRTNQVSPKIFEAIACRTALVLFEGDYSGVVKPDRHFVPLKKDFSNVDDVLARLADDRFLEELTERAFNDVIRSGHYSYQSFVEKFDALVGRRVRRGNGVVLLSAVAAVRTNGSASEWQRLSPFTGLTGLPTSLPLGTDRLVRQPLVSLARSTGRQLGKLWRLLPRTARARVAPISSRLRHLLLR